MECRNERIKRFYAQVWFEDSKDGIDIIHATERCSMFSTNSPHVAVDEVEAFCDAIEIDSEAYVGTQGKQPTVPLDYAMRLFLSTLYKCFMSRICAGDLLNMVHLSNGFRVVPGVKALSLEQEYTSSAKITEVTSSGLGRRVGVKGYIASKGENLVEISTSFLFRDAESVFESDFRDVVEPPMLLSLQDSNMLALIRSKEWFIPLDTDKSTISVGSVLKFELKSQYKFKSAKVYSYISTAGSVLVLDQSMGWTKAAAVDFESAEACGNPVIEFLERHGQKAATEYRFDHDGYSLIPESRRNECIAVAPVCNKPYSIASTDHNPIHTSEYIADYAGLPGVITHGMWTSASTRRFVETFAADGHPERIRTYDVQFMAMVLPSDQLATKLRHVGMRDGRKLIKVEAFNQNGTKVISGFAEVDQPPVAFIFTGQGAHHPGMGMGLYERSDVARRIWDSADEYMREIDQLATKLRHVGMRDGRKLIKVEAFNQNGTKVISGFAEVDQPPVAFIFTGQGAHHPGMGMGLYERSDVARRIWDSADEYMREMYGVSLINIVKHNPTTHTISFVGRRGVEIRENYRSMVYEYCDQNGSGLVSRPLFPEITEDTESFTFTSPDGLLYATQFTQPAMLVCEMAEFAYVESTGVVPRDAVFAGHSLGEYGGLASIGRVLTPELAADIGFCRGLTMQQSVRRDSNGRSIYGMVAVSPQRVSSYFRYEHLEHAVAAITQHGNYDGLLEIVNYNVRDQQYVVSGELVLLEALTRLLGLISSGTDAMLHNLASLAEQCVRAARKKMESGAYIEIERTRSTIPLPGIDVPFHSSLLNNGVSSFRKTLQSKIPLNSVSVERLRYRYIPNLTGRPFDITRPYIEHLYLLTKSDIAKDLMLTLDETRLEVDSVYAQEVAYKILIEILSYQFSSPVQWIQTQDVLLRQISVSRIIEIGPSGSVLANMVRRTLNSQSYSDCCYREADVTKDKLEVISSSTGMAKILFQDHANSGGTKESEASAANKPKDAVTAPSPQTKALSPQLPSSTGSVQVGAAKPIEDVPVMPLDIIRALIAHKLRCSLSSISDAKPLKSFVGGKSTLQNEIVGDLQKEFREDLPEKMEEIPLKEVAQGLSPITESLGKHTLGLVARLVSNKLPAGLNRAAVAQHLSSAYGLGPLRQDALLLVALTMEPGSRLDSEASAKEWLAEVANEYAKAAGIEYQYASPTDANGGSLGAVSVINSEDFEAAQKAVRCLAKQNMHALAAFLGLDSDQSAGAQDLASAQQVSDQLKAWTAEHGDGYYEGIQPVFSPAMLRHFDSSWNWARQDLLEHYFSLVLDAATATSVQSPAAKYLRLVNRLTPGVAACLKYIVGLLQKDNAKENVLPKLVELPKEGLNTPPAYQFTQKHLAPRLAIDERGSLAYAEVERQDERTITDYVRAITDNTGVCTHLSSSSKHDNALDTTIRRLGLDVATATPCKQAQPQGLPPMVHIKSRSNSPTSWEYDPDMSATWFDALSDIAKHGLSLSQKRVLVTGCGRGSIGAEVLKGLLEAGANVIATTSSYSASTVGYFRDIYQTHGSRGSSLYVVPFNQASQQDVHSLVEFIYGGSSKGKGLGWDLDFVLPFAAIPELGSDVSELDSQSELAHRAMLTNVLRMIGALSTCKRRKGYDMHPTLVILPLSPNHGTFGFDGLYSESKAGLETLFNRWHSEPWSACISLTGAAIGWTRGTGLMSGNDRLSESVEKAGVRTFSAAEMAFNILGVLHPKMYAQAALSPVWADMSGNFQYYPDLSSSIGQLRKTYQQVENMLRLVAVDSQIDYNVLAGGESERVYSMHTVDMRANHRFKFPTVKSYDQLEKLRHLQGMVDLDKVVVVTGYGEVGPFGNPETRWEMEAYGEFSLEGCIELAWIMGLIRHSNGKNKITGKAYTGWVDAKTEEPVEDRYIKRRYEKMILEHTGIRLIEPELMDGYDPSSKHIMRELQIGHDMEPFEATEEEARDFKSRNGDRVRIWANDNGSWSVRFLKGSTLMVPKALRFDRLVAAQLPSGWDPVRYGIPKEIATQVDPITCYGVVATVEALVRSGITDPYEIYKYVHVSEIGSSTGSGLGGQRSTKRVFAERLCDKDQPADVYQETFLSTPPAWINMLLLSASGPIKTTIGACATGVASVDVAVDTIQSGKAKIMLAGGLDGFSEESSFEFARMNATCSTLDEFAKGRSPAEMSRPCTSTRSGFVEGEGAGIVTLMSASTAIGMGVPIYGIIAMSSTATDKEGRSVPAPGKGILTTAREASGCSGCSQSGHPLLDINYRRRQLSARQAQIQEWAKQECAQMHCLQFVESEAKRQHAEALDTWGNSFWKNSPQISPLRGCLAVWGLTADDIGVASFHGTSTKANDKNESEIIEQQLKHLGRTPGNTIFSICQKYLTGHPKGAAAIWMLNGVLQSLRSGIVPGNRNADNIAAELERCEYIVYPSRSIQTSGIKAALLKSFGFGQVGGEVLVVHPDRLLAVLTREQLEEYAGKVSAREKKAYRYWHDTLVGNHHFVQIKTEPPYTAEQEEHVYLDPLARASHNPESKSYSF
ncbi:fatty acid synthase alpha subunit Lsd1 [Dipsacomyces acuminosporus]|nr:fatty acid synthase alpha subunit Lsd1 [Dipsacomyces acuminosporus]